MAKRPNWHRIGIGTLVLIFALFTGCERSGGHSTASSLSKWPSRTLTSTGVVQAITPATRAVYWLALSSQMSGSNVRVTPTRYVASGRITHGMSVSGVVGNPALTITGGWVWVVIGVGADAMVEQLDPTTLHVHAERSLSVKNTLYPLQYPLLTETLGGPLWVAAGEDMWALDPSTGTVESEFDAGNEISSMSSDPSGTLLYTGGEVPGESGMIVTEYSARTGRQLDRSDQQLALAAGTVAATNGGVWVSYRSGMAGSPQELSSKDLSRVAPPINTKHPFDTFFQMMGVSSAVSEGVLWLTSLLDLSCVDPVTSAVRASEAAGVSDPTALGGQLYARPSSGGVVVITPPRACFGK